MTSVVWTSESVERALADRLTSATSAAAGKPAIVHDVKDFLAETRDAKTIAFLDRTTIPMVAQVSHVALANPVIAVCDEPLQTAIGWLAPYPWVSHVISVGMLEHPIIGEHLDNVLKTVVSAQPRLLDWLGPSVSGRRIRLTHANRRAERLERMTEWFGSQGVGDRTQTALRDAAEELLTNAFYDAPVTAGAFKKPVSRTQDVALPDDSACDLAYGCRDDLAIVRVRDPFGSLSRRRLVEVLTRCARTGTVEVDETMGGAGLGMWRIFAAASYVAISVVKGKHTEILVGIAKRAAAGPRPYAFHFFFRESAKRRFWKLVSEDTTGAPPVNKSVMIVTRSK